VEIARGVSNYLKEKRLASPADLRGRLRIPADTTWIRRTRDPSPENPLIVALDVSDTDRADALASRWDPTSGC
jgi:hypothetical protein